MSSQPHQVPVVAPVAPPPPTYVAPTAPPPSPSSMSRTTTPSLRNVASLSINSSVCTSDYLTVQSANRRRHSDSYFPTKRHNYRHRMRRKLHHKYSFSPNPRWENDERGRRGKSTMHSVRKSLLKVLQTTLRAKRASFKIFRFFRPFLPLEKLFRPLKLCLYSKLCNK